jgi:hypothetical protein
LHQDLYAGGWRWRTSLGLSHALPWPSDQRGRADATFVDGNVPEALVDPVLDLPVLQIAGDGTALVRFDGIGRFLLRRKRVTCQIEAEREAAVIDAVIFGNVLAAFCWQRGQLPLHGSAIAIDGRAILLLGRAATGKSILSAALAQRGHAVLGDEVAVIAEGACLPAGGTLSLAEDALRLLGISGNALPGYDNFSLAKRLWHGGAAVEPRPYPIATVICLAKAEVDTTATLQRLGAADAIDAILNQVYWRGMLTVGEAETRIRRDAERLAAFVPIYRLPIARRLDAIPPLVALIERYAVGNL